MIEINIAPSELNSKVRSLNQVSREINDAVIPFVQGQLIIPIKSVKIWDMYTDDGCCEVLADIYTDNDMYELEIHWRVGSDPLKVDKYVLDHMSKKAS